MTIILSYVEVRILAAHLNNAHVQCSLIESYHVNSAIVSLP